MRRLLIGAFASICIIPLVVATAVSCHNYESISTEGGNGNPNVIPPSQNKPSIPNIDNNINGNPGTKPDIPTVNPGIPDVDNGSKPDIPSTGPDTSLPPAQPDVTPDQGRPEPQPLPQPQPEQPTQPPAPTPSPTLPPAAPTMNFRVDIRRTSGFKFTDANIQFKLYNDVTNEPIKSKNGTLWHSDWDDSDEGFLNLELPSNYTYRLQAESIDRTKYDYPESIKFSKDDTNIKYPFDPIIQTTPRTESYRIDDVVHTLPYTEDVLHKPISLEQNKAAGKATILVHFRTTCPKSQRTLNMLYGAINWDLNGEETPWMWDKVDVICISNVDTVEELQRWETEKKLHPEFQFVRDTENTVVDKFFHNDLSYPRLAFLDWQGVWVYRMRGEMSADGKNKARDLVKQYSKQTPATPTNVVAIKEERDE